MRKSNGIWLVACIWLVVGVINGFILCDYLSQRDEAEVPSQVNSAVEPQVDTVAELVSILAGNRTIAPDHYFFQIAQKIHGTAYWFEDIDPFMVARLVYTESRGDSLALSSANAVGLGQIRPSVWLGAFPHCGDNLNRIRDNICYTVHILDHYQKTSPTQEMALLSYNGCKSSHCLWYPRAIMANAEAD